MISGFRKILTATLSLLFYVVNVNASEYFIVNGLGYKITSESTVALTNIYEGDEGSDGLSWPLLDNGLYVYEGDINVPSEVSYGGNTYTVTAIDAYTFGWFENLGVVTLPPTVTAIGESAFDSSRALQIIISGVISEIERNAFFDCQGVESIALDVTDVPEYCFELSSLAEVSFSDKLRTIDTEAFWGVNIAEVVIPNGVTSVGVSAFHDCFNLKSVTLPSNDAFTTIKDGSFQNCSSLEKLIIPKNVTTIETEAFKDSKSLQYIKSDAYYAPSLSATAFKGADVNNVQLFVPTGAGENYSTAAVWKDFKSIYAGPIVAINMSTDPIATGKVMGEGFFGNDATITLTAEANPKYKFVGWEFEKPSGLITEESVEGNVNKLGFVLTTAIINAMNDAGKDLDVIAKFEKLTFGITLAAVEEEWGQIVNVETDEVVSGTTVVSEIDSKLYVAAQAADGYEFVKWVDGNGNEVSTKTNLIIDVQANKTYKAVFKHQYEITVASSVENGKILLSTSKAKEGETVTLTFEPATGYAVDNASITTNVTGLVITDNSFVMPKQDVEISAVFIEDICMVCNEVAEVGDLYDWILMVNNSDLEAKGYKFGENDVEWYQVNGEPDEWCDGEQNAIGEADEKVKTGYYFMDDKTSLIGTGDYYVVIRLVAGQKCKAITSKVISYTSNKSLYLTPSAVRQGQSLTLTGLPDADATVRIYDMNGKQVRMIKTDGAQSITFEAENAAGVYVVNVSAGPVSKSIKYVVK